MANVMTELSPRQIASDVQVQRNSQSGSVEYIAPSFDPFEANYELAGLASLRSTAGATSINGQRLGSGALLDLSLFYSTANNDIYGGHGYGQAIYISGEPLPTVFRDTKILECSEDVYDTVYYHESYYRPSFRTSYYRPTRFYTGSVSYTHLTLPTIYPV